MISSLRECYQNSEAEFEALWKDSIIAFDASTILHSDGHLLGRCDGEAEFKAFLGEADDLIRNIHGVAQVVEIDVDEVGYLVAKVAEIKRRK